MPLGLPGAQAIRLDPPVVEGYQELTADLRALPDSFFTLPGMYSLYFWSERESPTTLELTNWMYMLDDRQQEHIVEELASRPNLRVVYSPSVMAFWMASARDLSPTPLIRYIAANFAPATEVGDFGIWVRQATPATPDPPLGLSNERPSCSVIRLLRGSPTRPPDRAWLARGAVCGLVPVLPVAGGANCTRAGSAARRRA